MWLLSSVILFMGCPTPPDKAQTGGAPQNQQTPPPQGNPNGNQPGAQGNMPAQGSPDGSPKPSVNAPDADGPKANDDGAPAENGDQADGTPAQPLLKQTKKTVKPYRPQTARRRCRRRADSRRATAEC